MYSTSGQVGSALDRAMDLVTRSNPRENVIAQFWMERGQRSSKTYIQNPGRLFPEVGTVQGDIDLRATGIADKFNSPILQSLKRNKIIRKDVGDCLRSSIGKHTDASVSLLRGPLDVPTAPHFAAFADHMDTMTMKEQEQWLDEDARRMDIRR